MRETRITAVLWLLLVCGCTSEEEARIRAAQAYLQGRGSVPEDIRLAILGGKVLPGMSPDEAYHAAGAFVYEAYGAPQGVFPPDVIFSQRQRPDPDVAIRLRFRNRTQYGGDEVPFSVTFLNGKAVRARHEITSSHRGRANDREARSEDEDVYGEYDESERRSIAVVQPAECRG